MKKFLSLLILCVATETLAAPVPESKAFQPTIVVRIRPIDDLLAEAKFVASLIARAAPTPADAKRVVDGIDAGLDETWGPDWRKALDTTRPAFAYGFVAENIEASTGAVLIPVRDETAFLAWVERLAAKPIQQSDGIYRFEIPPERSPSGTPMPGFLRLRDRYAYVTARDATVLGLDKLPAPAQIMAEEKGAVASARVFIERVPKLYRDVALGGIGSFKAMLKGEHGPNAPGGMMPFVGMWAMSMGLPLIEVYPYLEPIVRDGQDATLHLMFDRQKLDLALDLEVAPKPGSAFAQQVAAWKPRTSRFTSWTGANAAAALTARLTLPEDLRTAWADKMEAALNAETPNEESQAVVRLNKSLLPTMRAGDIDIAFALHPAAKTQGYTAVAGVQVGNGKAVENAMRDVVKILPKTVTDIFKLDAAKIDGVNVHHITVPTDELGPLKALIGDAPLRLAFKPDVVLATFGPEADQLLAAGLKATASPENGFRLSGSLKKLAPMVKALDENASQMFDKFVGNDLDRIALIDSRVEGGKTLRVHQNISTMFFGTAFFGLSARAAFPAPIPPPPAAPRPIKP